MVSPFPRALGNLTYDDVISSLYILELSTAILIKNELYNINIEKMDEGKNKGLLQSSAILTLWLMSFVHAVTEHTPRTATDLIFICITSCQRRLASNYSTVTRRRSSSTGSPCASLLVPVGEPIPAHHQEGEKNLRTAMFSPVQCSQDPAGSVLKSLHSQIARLVPARQQQHAVPAGQGGICSAPQPQPAAVDAFDLMWGNPGSKCISAAPRSKRSNRH